MVTMYCYKLFLSCRLYPLWIGLFWITSVLSADNTVVFEAKYDVSWKGWNCGSMHSQLWQKEDLSYVYQQHLKSTLFFLSFDQKEESAFFITNGNIDCKKYQITRQGIEGPSYTVLFYPENIEVHYEGYDDLVHYKRTGKPFYDKLVMQLVLIRDILKNNAPGDRTVSFIDISGEHDRTYKLTIHEDVFTFQSHYGEKSSAFTLDPKRRYLPTMFEQYRHGSLALKGELVDASFGIGWDAFIT